MAGTVLPSVLVPLCGKSLDMHFLAETANVVGLELSAAACEAFFTEANYEVIVEQANPKACHHLWRTPKVHPFGSQIHIWQGDYFTVQPRWVEQCHFIYDRAALIALPPPMRLAYVEKLRALVPQGSLLLITLEYPSQERQGPPFSVETAEVHKLFAFGHIELVGIRDITGIGFAQRRFATSSLVEKAYIVTW
jgi:thiopurine S-methyltransferase